MAMVSARTDFGKITKYILVYYGILWYIIKINIGIMENEKWNLL